VIPESAINTGNVTSKWFSFVPADSLKMALWCRNMDQFDVCIGLYLVEWIRRLADRVKHLTNSLISSTLVTINTVRQ